MLMPQHVDPFLIARSFFISVEFKVNAVRFGQSLCLQARSAREKISEISTYIPSNGASCDLIELFFGEFLRWCIKIRGARFYDS